MFALVGSQVIYSARDSPSISREIQFASPLYGATKTDRLLIVNKHTPTATEHPLDMPLCLSCGLERTERRKVLKACQLDEEGRWREIDRKVDRLSGRQVRRLGSGGRGGRERKENEWVVVPGWLCEFGD